MWIWALCGFTLPSIGQTLSDSLSNSRYTLYYYCDRIEIEKDYLDNNYQILRIKEVLRHSKRIDSLTIYAYASPEGPLARNKWLAKKRAEAARDFILENLPESTALKPENIHLRPMGENWIGLEAELEANYHLPNRDRVLRIMRAKVSTETKKWRLKNLDNGYTYHLIITRHMPRLRMATWIVVHTPVPALIIKIDELQFPDKLDTISKPELIDSVSRRTIMALKSNLLYDALTFANFSVEVPITKHFSALYYHQFPWWRWGESQNEYCMRFLSIGAEARWWFWHKHNHSNGRYRDKFAGHFFGVYAESGKWDFNWQRNICYQGEHWSTGLSYGYAMPIGRRLNMEFSFSFGYAAIPFRGYIPSEDYSILWRDPQNTGKWHYFGPTKAQISLVVPITAKVKNLKKKGGKR